MYSSGRIGFELGDGTCGRRVAKFRAFRNHRYVPREKMRAGIAALPDGTYRFADTCDNPELGRALLVSV